MKTVHVDAARCQGHARCFALAPDYFDFDDEGYAFVPDDRSRFDTLPADLEKAVGNCPERAIIVEDTGV